MKSRITTKLAQFGIGQIECRARKGKKKVPELIFFSLFLNRGRAAPLVYRRPAIVRRREPAPVKATPSMSPRQEARSGTIDEEAVRARQTLMSLINFLHFLAPFGVFSRK